MHRQPLGKSEGLGTEEWMCGELPGVPSTQDCPSVSLLGKKAQAAAPQASNLGKWAVW